MIGNLCFGKTTEELRKIKVASIESLIENLKPETAQVDAQKRALKSKFFSLIPINLRKAGPLCDVITLHGLENTDVEGEIGLSGHYNRTWMPWRTDQASQLIEKIKDLKGESSTWDESTIRIVSDISLLRGLSRDNISRISLSNFTLEQFSDDKYLLDGQKDALIKAFESKRGFSRATLGGVESMGDILINTEKDDLEQMSRDLALQAILQMGGVDLKDRPYLWIKQKLDIAMKIMRRKDASQLTSDDIILLGNLICGMTSSHFKEMNNEAYNDIIDFIGERLCFDSSQLKALADKAKEVLKKKRQVGNVLSIVTGGEISEMGCIVEGFSPNDLRNLSENTIRANIDFLATRNFSGEQARVLMEKLDSKQRQGQDIVLDISSLTGEDLIQRRNILVGLSPADIVNINNTSYDEAATVVGEINGFTRKQLEAWATKAKQAWNRNVALFTSSQLLRLGNVAIGFSDDDIRQMALDTDDVIQYLGSQKIQIGNNPGYISSQLKSALSRIKDHKDKVIKQFTSNEISNLKNFAVAMTTDEIDSIDKSAFLSCIGQLGTLKGWSVGQMKKLKYKAIEAYQQPINKWTPAQLRGAGSVIGGCTSSELKLFTEEQVSMVTPDAIKSIPPSLFASFTSSQLRQFDLSQSAAVTSEQLKELSSENEGIIKRKTGYEKPQVSGVQQVLFVDSPTVLMLCIAVLLQDLLNHGFFTMCTSQLAYLL